METNESFRTEDYLRFLCQMCKKFEFALPAALLQGLPIFLRCPSCLKTTGFFYDKTSRTIRVVPDFDGGVNSPTQPVQPTTTREDAGSRG